MTSQLRRLATPFPAQFVEKNPTGYGHYVAHDVVTQRLLAILGPFGTSVVEVIRGTADKCDGEVITGVLLALHVEIDGRKVTVTEVGDCERPDNWKTDGARLKDAMSDAIKRCAMRLGVGLHLWSGDAYVLPQWLDKAESSS